MPTEQENTTHSFASFMRDKNKSEKVGGVNLKKENRTQKSLRESKEKEKEEKKKELEEAKKDSVFKSSRFGASKTHVMKRKGQEFAILYPLGVLVGGLILYSLYKFISVIPGLVRSSVGNLM